jgi:exonuclease SbcD
MRIIHTSDWHLGHTLHDQPREYEHRVFLAWLLDAIESHAIDGLIIAGDVFETTNPPAAALRMWYDFLAHARLRFPELDIVVISGNHDSAARLEAAEELTHALRIRVVGGLKKLNGETDTDRLVWPITARGGKERAWIAAVPFLRAFDLPAVPDGHDPVVDGARAAVSKILDAARRCRESGEALIATAHGYIRGGRISEHSERHVFVGGQAGLPVDIFPEDLTYVALGHLHLAQPVGGRENVRYSGSAIPLSLAEAGYEHQVCLVEIERGELRGVHSLRIPRAVEMLRIPAQPAPPGEVVELLRALPIGPTGRPREEWPFLQVRVSLDGPQPWLRPEIDEALQGKAVRLIDIQRQCPANPKSLVGDGARREIEDFDPEKIFAERYRREYGSEPAEVILAAFRELLEEVQQGEGEEAA